ncbi:MAG: hypothetical protein BGN96_08310 [Bacteroidales bacterium 45-6]|nr:MAG: hypothetical protein BGN96_08310 [Bacteroidales bacterium 45-6]
MKKVIPTFLVLFFFSSLACFSSNKSIYVPSSMGDPNNANNSWTYTRSKQSANWIIFWEAGYGANPNSTSLSTDYRIDVDNLLQLAENAFNFYTDSLKFTKRGSSKTDQYKMIIRLRYTRDWEATGSGVDNTIGMLTLTAWSAQVAGHTLAHEVGHCFQYQVHCDNNDLNGWMYGFGPNGSGGNCWWEQCAQWQGYKIYPEKQFTDADFSTYLTYAHKHILHETPRYSNYFIQDYWTMLHGMDFIGRMWNESKSPEDPVEAYQRMTKITQSAFCDEMYDCAARFASWDIPALRSYGESKIDARPQTKMNRQSDGYWQVDSLSCPENYGYNVIRLNVPSNSNKVKAYFQGLAGSTGFRKLLYGYAEWRYGFVALLENGQRVYSPMQTARYLSPKDTVEFTAPTNCKRLWFVVSGAPKAHWRHAWDNDDSNDEQWPYKVKFDNSNLYGTFDYSNTDVAHNDTLTYNLTQAPFVGSTSSAYPSTPVYPDMARVAQAFRLQLSDIAGLYGSKISYCAVNPNGTLNYTSTANAPGHWFNKTGYTTNWGNSSYIFSELNTTSFAFSIGQYPNLCKEGDKFTIRQALLYKPDASKTYQVTFVFNVTVSASSGIETERGNTSSEGVVLAYSSNNVLHLKKLPDGGNVRIYDLLGKSVLSQVISDNTLSVNLPSGTYIVLVSDSQKKVVSRNKVFVTK